MVLSLSMHLSVCIYMHTVTYMKWLHAGVLVPSLEWIQEYDLFHGCNIVLVWLCSMAEITLRWFIDHVPLSLSQESTLLLSLNTYTPSMAGQVLHSIS